MDSSILKEESAGQGQRVRPVHTSVGFRFSLTRLLMIPGPRLKRKSVQVAPRPGNNWSAARQISLKKFRISSSVLSDVIQLSISVTMSTHTVQVSSLSVTVANDSITIRLLNRVKPNNVLIIVIS